MARLDIEPRAPIPSPRAEPWRGEERDREIPRGLAGLWRRAMFGDEGREFVRGWVASKIEIDLERVRLEVDGALDSGGGCSLRRGVGSRSCSSSEPESESCSPFGGRDNDISDIFLLRSSGEDEGEVDGEDEREDEERGMSSSRNASASSSETLHLPFVFVLPFSLVASPF